MTDGWTWLLVGALTLLMAGYLFLRFGPKRCPKCRTWNWGVPSIPVGIRRFLFQCKKCGEKYEGHKRLPL